MSHRSLASTVALAAVILVVLLVQTSAAGQTQSPAPEDPAKSCIWWNASS